MGQANALLLKGKSPFLPSHLHSSSSFRFCLQNPAASLLRTLSGTDPLHEAISVIITADEYPACCVCSLLPDLAELTEVANDELISPRQAVGACRRLGEERGQRQGHSFFSWALRTSSFPRKHTFTILLPGWPLPLNWKPFDKNTYLLLIEAGCSVSLTTI